MRRKNVLRTLIRQECTMKHALIAPVAEAFARGTTRVSPTPSNRAKLTDPAAFFAVSYAGPVEAARFVASQFVWGTPGSGHSTTWNEAR